MNPRRLIAAGLFLAATSCARSPSRTAGSLDAPRLRVDAVAPSIVADAALLDATSGSIAPNAATGGCAQGLLAAGSSWVVEREGSYEGDGCYGVGDTWSGRDVLRVHILDAQGDRPMHVAVEDEGSTLAKPDGGAVVADFARTMAEAPGCARRTRGIDGVEEHEDVEAWDLLDVFAAPCRAPSQKPVRPNSTEALALRYRHALKLDDDDSGTTLMLTPRGFAQRPFGRVRAFAVRGSILNGGAGMCHSWTTTLRGSGMLYLAEHEDVIVEASFQGTATTDEGSCMGCGPGGELRCPPKGCARGPAKVTLRLRCE
jgi:hypothetical protein